MLLVGNLDDSVVDVRVSVVTAVAFELLCPTRIVLAGANVVAGEETLEDGWVLLLQCEAIVATVVGIAFATGTLLLLPPPPAAQLPPPLPLEVTL